MFKQRIEKLLQRCELIPVNALLVTSVSHIRYLTGFSGSHALCLLAPSGRYLVTDGRYREQAKQEAKGFSLLTANGSLLEAIAAKIPLRAKLRVGIQHQYLSLAAFENLKDLFPKVRFIPIGSVIDEAMAIKDDHEIACIRDAAAITDRVWKKILPLLKENVAELDIAAEISYFHKKFGAEADAFEPIVASGVRSALPHARSSSKRLKNGELVVLDFGCRVGGYHSDLTRTVAVGRWSSQAKKIYHAVLHAQQLAIASMRVGVAARTLDHLVRCDLRRSGLAKYFTHSLGHGLGLQVHELPRLSSLSKDLLAAGNVLTIEPGVYIPGFGGVRIEDDLLLRETSAECLTTASKELITL